MDRGGRSLRGSTSSHQFSDNNDRRRGVLGSRSGQTVGPWQRTVPALLKSAVEFGDSFIDNRRKQRMNPGIGRATSDVREILSGPSMNSSFIHRRENSFNDNLRPQPARASSVYERPRSSFQPSQRLVVRQRDDWMEVDRQQQYSSEEDYGGSISEDEELVRYHSKRNYDEAYEDFDEDDIFVFGVIQLSVKRARQIVQQNPPPSQFWELKAVEKTAYLYYYTLYKRYIQPVKKFHNIFNREFYKYTSEGASETEALLKICNHTKAEYDRQRQKVNKQAYDRSRRHLFSDDRATPDSRASDRPSYSELHDESDLASTDSGIKEPLKFNKPHSLISFGSGGKLCLLNPESSIYRIDIEYVKTKIKDLSTKRNIEALEAFKGPLISGKTQPHAPLLFIERQIGKILNSEIYHQNPESSDANDVLLIWRLLEILILQQGMVIGPDLARLLTKNYSYPTKPTRGRSDKEHLTTTGRNDSPIYGLKDERRVDGKSLDRFTQFLLGGYIDEAIESAMNDGLLFDALILAYRMYGNNRQQLEQIETKLLAFRNPQQPALTLLSVASEMPVPILNNLSSANDVSGWRAHIAIVLANYEKLNKATARKTVHELGLALSRKEFNAAADFCFLAANLLDSDYDCFEQQDFIQNDDEEPFRKHITLINASLPDDKYYSTQTSYGWSITDFQATEIYDFAIRMKKNPGSDEYQKCRLEGSDEYQKCRLEYAHLLSEYGGFATSAYNYCAAVATCIWNRANLIEPSFLYDICNLASSLQFAAEQTSEEVEWIKTLRTVAEHSTLPQIQPKREINENHLQPTTTNMDITQDPEQSIISSNEKQIQMRLSEEKVVDKIFKNESQHDSSKLSNSLGSFVTSTPVTSPSQTTDVRSFQDPEGQSPTRNYFEPREDIIPKDIVQQHGYQQFVPTNSIPPMSIYSPTEQNVIKTISPPLSPKNITPMINEVRKMSITQGPSSPKQKISQEEWLPTIPKQEIAHETKPAAPILQRTTSMQKSESVPAMVNQHKEQFHPQQQQLQQEKEKSVQKQGTEQKQSGFFKGLKNTLTKIIPASNEMILPDDSHPAIRWDPVLGKYVGEGVEEEHAPPPPPAMPTMPTVPVNQPQMTPVAAPNTTTRPVTRRPGAARYVNPLANTATASSSSHAPEGLNNVLPPTGMAPPALPATFGFIPAPVQDDDESVNPFSDGPPAPSTHQQNQ